MRAPVVGRVCMDMTMIDVTHVKGAQVGDEVVLMGRQGDQEISIDDMAERLSTINYEITCLVGKRVPRVYVNE
jgi:alanine racemase